MRNPSFSIISPRTLLATPWYNTAVKTPVDAYLAYNAGMYRLTREVRFAVNPGPDAQAEGRPSNGFGGFPSLAGLGHYFIVQVTLDGELDAKSNYLINIRDVDAAVRNRAVPAVRELIRSQGDCRPETVVRAVHHSMLDAWPGVTLQRIRLYLTPYFSAAILPGEPEMVRLSQKFEFSATHRLHNPQLSDEENRQLFGKCNNPHGHGHNYELEVTLAGRPDANGVLLELVEFERIVTATVIDRFDHKNLNIELPEFKQTIPTVENIARITYDLLKPRFADTPARLASVTVWETPKTWCEYAG